MEIRQGPVSPVDTIAAFIQFWNQTNYMVTKKSAHAAPQTFNKYQVDRQIG